MAKTLLDHLALVEEYADNFVTHWMEDDGNDAEDKAECQRASDDITASAEFVRECVKLVERIARHTDYVEMSRDGVDGIIGQARGIIKRAGG